MSSFGRYEAIYGPELFLEAIYRARSDMEHPTFAPSPDAHESVVEAADASMQSCSFFSHVSLADTIGAADPRGQCGLKVVAQYQPQSWGWSRI